MYDVRTRGQGRHPSRPSPLGCQPCCFFFFFFFFFFPGPGRKELGCTAADGGADRGADTETYVCKLFRLENSPLMVAEQNPSPTLAQQNPRSDVHPKDDKR